MTGLWSHLRALVTGPHDTDPVLDVAVERAAYRVDPRLKQLRSYPGRYRPTIQRVLSRVRQLAADVPGPITLDTEHYTRDPFVHALFGGPEDINRLLSTPAMHTYVAEHGGDDMYALLSMRRVEKSVFGLELAGSILRRDVAQRVIHFTDPQLIGPAPTEQDARDNLLWHLFDRYMEHVAQGMERLRGERQRLAQEKDFALARLRGVSADRRATRQQELDKVLVNLGEAAATLDLEYSGEVFEAVLAHPEDCLALVIQHLNLDTMGVIHADAAAPGVTSLEFVNLIERERETRCVVLVHCRDVRPVSPGEMLEAARQRLG